MKLEQFSLIKASHILCNNSMRHLFNKASMKQNLLLVNAKDENIPTMILD